MAGIGPLPPRPHPLRQYSPPTSSQASPSPPL